MDLVMATMLRDTGGKLNFVRIICVGFSNFKIVYKDTISAAPSELILMIQVRHMKIFGGT